LQHFQLPKLIVPQHRHQVLLLLLLLLLLLTLHVCTVQQQCCLS
jgi:hypothetical protein